jgi:hypothetical protein
VKEGSQQFFFEKKNQKTFICAAQRPAQIATSSATRNRQKFFGSFFQKRTTSS